MDWRTVEMLGYTHYSLLGYRVLVPLVNNFGYDFVAEKDGEYLRVNVKVASNKDPVRKNSWAISKTGRQTKNTKQKNSVDVFLAYLPTQKKFVELPGNFFDNTTSKTKHIPVKLLG